MATMTIEQLRAQMRDIGRELEEARSAAVALAMDKDADPAAMSAATARLNALKDRRDIVKESLDAMTEAQSANLKAVRDDMQSVKKASERFKGAGDFFSCVAQACNPTNPVVDPRLAEYMQIKSSASGQNITTDADGGYLVPPDYSDELITHAQSQSVLLPKTRHIPISGNRLITNELEEESRKDTVVSGGTRTTKGRNGGILGYWTSEAADFTASSMKFVQKTTPLNKLTALVYATEEMMEDLPALSTLISQRVSDEMAFQCDNKILNGSGSGEPLGLLAAGNAAKVVIAKESGQAAASIVLNNILKMFNAMPAANRKKAEWYINQDVEIALYMLLMSTGSTVAEGLTIANGVPVFVPAGGLASAPNGLLLGRPIVPVEQCAALGTVGDVVFADLSEYMWIDKSNVNAQTSIHVRFVQDEMAFKFSYRAGGRPRWSSAISAYNGTTSRSPYVALATRA